MIEFVRGQDPIKSMGMGKWKLLKDLLDAFISDNDITISDVPSNIRKEDRLQIVDLRKYKCNILSYSSFEFFEEFFRNRSENEVEFFRKIEKLLLSYTPVFLVDPVDMPNEDHRENSPDYLGYYTGMGSNSIQSIFLCPERIHGSSTQHNICLEHLLAKVLLHEFGHAMMGCFKREDATSEYIKSDLDFFRFIEEPLANLITLHIAKSFPAFELEVKGFIKAQPSEYRLGLYLYESSEIDELEAVKYINKWIKLKKEDLSKFSTDEKREWVNFLEGQGYKISEGNSKLWVEGFERFMKSLP